MAEDNTVVLTHVMLTLNVCTVCLLDVSRTGDLTRLCSAGFPVQSLSLSEYNTHFPENSEGEDVLPVSRCVQDV